MNKTQTIFGWTTFCCATRTAATAATLILGTAVAGVADDAQTVATTAGGLGNDTGGGARINLSGKLRMLSQRIPASACYLVSDVNTDNSAAMLASAQEEFAVIMAALRDGNDDLGVFGMEERRKTLVGLERLDGFWAPVNEGATKVSQGAGTFEDIQQLADASVPLLEMAKRMVTELSQQYSNSADLLVRDALTIDIAGRQRMLAQRVSKNACLVSNGIASEVALAEMEAAAGTFEASLLALRNGLPEAGVQAPPTPEIAEGLDGVVADWQTVKPLIERLKAGDTLDKAELSTVFTLSNNLTGGMNAVVGLYTAAVQSNS